MIASHGASMPETDRMADGEAMISPFAAAEFGGETLFEQAEAFEVNTGALESPFAEAMALSDETSLEGLAMVSVLGELEDEEFDEAVQGLVDEAAARHLTSAATWSSESEAPTLAALHTRCVSTTVDRLPSRNSAARENHPRR